MAQSGADKHWDNLRLLHTCLCCQLHSSARITGGHLVIAFLSKLLHEFFKIIVVKLHHAIKIQLPCHRNSIVVEILGKKGSCKSCFKAEFQINPKFEILFN